MRQVLSCAFLEGLLGLKGWGKSHLEVVSGGGGALQGTGALCLEAESTGAGRTGAVSENATSLL